MTLLSDFDPEKKHTILGIGKNGSGKSIAFTSWPKPLLWINFDQRIKPVYRWWMQHNSDVMKDIDFRTFSPGQYERVGDLLDQLQQVCKFRTVIMDPLTYFADMLLVYSMSFRGADKGTRKGRLVITDPDDYKTENQGLMQAIRLGQIIPAHFILIAHIMEDIYYPLGEDKPRITRRLITAGKPAGAKIPGLFDEVWLFRTQMPGVVGAPAHYIVNTRPSVDYDTLRTSCPTIKSEIDWTGKASFYDIVAPDLDLIVKKERIPEGVIETEDAPR